MVTKWGLSESLGPLMYDQENEEVFLGKSAGSSQSQVSNETAKKIDTEVRLIIDDCYQRARRLIEDNREKLEAMAEALLEFETIDRNQIDQIMQGKKPSPPEDWDDASPGGTPNPQNDYDLPDPSFGEPAPEH